MSKPFSDRGKVTNGSHMPVNIQLKKSKVRSHEENYSTYTERWWKK